MILPESTIFVSVLWESDWICCIDFGNNTEIIDGVIV
jgi:hypothetical protein